MTDQITPYKGRTVLVNEPIEMYRCLNRKGRTFSIRQFGLVVGHTEDLVLYECSLIVTNGGKKRGIKTKMRNVHAFIRGSIIGTSDTKYEKRKLLYDPFILRGFHCDGMDGDLTESKMIVLNPNGIYIQI